MTPVEKAAIDQQVAAQACVGVCDELASNGVAAKDLAVGMLMAAAATLAGANVLLTPEARGALLARLSRAFTKTMDDEMGKPGSSIIQQKD